MVEKELKKGSSDFDTGNPILATAESEAIARINSDKSGTKIAFLVRVEDQKSPTKERVFAALKLIEFGNYVEIIGIELLANKNKKEQKIDRYSQVLEKAIEETVVDIKFPWHKINEIQNVSYQYKMQNKGK